MSCWLGVTLGEPTTGWALVAFDAGAAVRMCGLVASAVRRSDDGQVIADGGRQGSDERRVGGFVDRLGQPTPIVIGGTPYGIEALIGRVIAGIVSHAEALQGRPPVRVAISHADDLDEYRLGLLAEACRTAGLPIGSILFVSSSTAAAAAAAANLHDVAPELIEPTGAALMAREQDEPGAGGFALPAGSAAPIDGSTVVAAAAGAVTGGLAGGVGAASVGEAASAVAPAAGPAAFAPPTGGAGYVGATPTGGAGYAGTTPTASGAGYAGTTPTTGGYAGTETVGSSGAYDGSSTSEAGAGYAGQALPPPAMTPAPGAAVTAPAPSGPTPVRVRPKRTSVIVGAVVAGALVAGGVTAAVVSSDDPPTAGPSTTVSTPATSPVTDQATTTLAAPLEVTTVAAAEPATTVPVIAPVATEVPTTVAPTTEEPTTTAAPLVPPSCDVLLAAVQAEVGVPPGGAGVDGNAPGEPPFSRCFGNVPSPTRSSLFEIWAFSPDQVPAALVDGSSPSADPANYAPNPFFGPDATSDAGGFAAASGFSDATRNVFFTCGTARCFISMEQAVSGSSDPDGSVLDAAIKRIIDALATATG